MRRFLALACLSILVPIFNPVCAQHWEWLNPKPTGNLLKTVRFTDALTGFIVGKNGTILKTVDGGVTWSGRYSGTMNFLHDISFPDVNTGYIVGEGATILKTTDNGETWTAQNAGTYEVIMYVDFPDPTTGYATGDHVLKRTIDGGDTWNDLDIGTFEMLRSPWFINNDKGFMIENILLFSYETRIWKTENGGVTWNMVYGTSEYL